ncbi:BEL1-like homeodomain protein [Castilleja foliolosa]|uniref:BEL1-like homeodomain protein n=1 Tax=Castilleja foliolosa TaxID=1961234 RepID=A0ABD3DIC5_9LAMI
MAEGFEPYHVPQQSRRDKLRVNNHHHHPPPPLPGCVDTLQACASLLPLYDPSLIPSDFLHRHPYTLAAAGVKEEAMNQMGFLSAANHVFADPNLNPSYIHQDINGGPFTYPSSPGPGHCYRPVVLDHQQPYQQEPISNSGQSLSLSLSSHHNNNSNSNNMQKYDFSNPIELSKSTVPLGPFTGYASVLKGSRFLRPAHQLMEEFCDMGRGIYTEKTGPDPGLLDPPQLGNLNRDEIVNDCGDGVEQTRKKSKLLSMLDEVYKRYKQYYQQMQAAVAAFESIAGLSSAAPFAYLALKAMSKHFRCLKNAITDQLQFSSKSHGKINYERDETQRLENSGKISSGGYGQRSFQGSGFIDPPVWRPQRGLPEHAVAVLRSWLFEHFLHPYPTDTDKVMLAKQTGLSRNQVSNWFINARVRLWKPMVEEIHMLETRQGQNSMQREEQSPNTTHDRPPTSTSIECENNASSSIQRSGEYPSKRTREGPTETPRENRAPMKSPYDHLLPSNNNQQMHVGMSNPVGGNSGVSLTLGLHQNVGLGMSDSYPINAARRFGLDSHGEEYVVSGFIAAQNRQFGRDIMEGQTMHDFVG